MLSPVTFRTACIGWRLVIRWHEDGEVLPRPLEQLGHWDPIDLWANGCPSYDEHLGMISAPDQAWLDAVRED